MAFVLDNTNIKQIVGDYLKNSRRIPTPLRGIRIGDWNVSRVTKMDYLFYGAKMFNEDISNWDVSNVTTMAGMFEEAKNFNQDIGNWNVSNVTTMVRMFREATNFNQDIGRWNVSKVTIMAGMFDKATNFNQNIGNWNVSNVTHMPGMFWEATNFNQDIGNWNVSKVEIMDRMFGEALRFNQDLSRWDVSNVIDMTSMFYATNLRINPNWNISSRCNTSHMFDSTPLQGQENQRPLRRPAIPAASSVSAAHAARSEYDHPSLRPVTNTTATPAAASATTTATATPALPPSPPVDNAIMNKINETIDVFNPLIPGDEKASVFFQEQEDYTPFIIRTPQGTFSGDAIDWPSVAGKEFIECKDNTPSNWQGNSYKKYIKPGGRTFIKMNIGGTPTLVEKPSWYTSGTVPGTKYFDLVKSGDVDKFMSSVLASQNLPEEWNALGADHCNQIGPSGTYVLVQISQDELDTIVNSQTKGGRRRINKRKRSIKKRRNSKRRKTVRKYK